MANTIEQQPEHYRLAPSSAHRWLKCPASAGAQDEESEASRLGTIAHEILKERLEKGSPLSVDAGMDPYEPSEEQLEVSDCVERAADFVERLPGRIVGLERRFRHPWIEEHGGTIDVIVYDEDTATLHIVDYKHGKYEVFAAGNSQLKCYLNLARKEFPDAKRFFATIFQPRVKNVPDTAEFTAAELADHELAVLDASVSEEYHTGEHCQWCPLLMVDGVPCAAAFQRLKEQAEMDFDVIHEKPIQERIEALETIYQWQKVSRFMASAAKTLLVQYARDGAQLSKFKVAYWPLWPEWTGEEEALKYLRGLIDDDDLSDFMEPSRLKSPAKIRSLLKQRGIKVKKFPEGLTKKSIRGYQLTALSSYLPAVDFQNDFIDLTATQEDDTEEEDT